MNGNDWSAVLPDLLCLPGEGGDKRNGEAFFNGHGEVIVCFLWNCNNLVLLLLWVVTRDGECGRAGDRIAFLKKN